MIARHSYRQRRHGDFFKELISLLPRIDTKITSWIDIPVFGFVDTNNPEDMSHIRVCGFILAMKLSLKGQFSSRKLTFPAKVFKAKKLMDTQSAQAFDWLTQPEYLYKSVDMRICDEDKNSIPCWRPHSHRIPTMKRLPGTYAYRSRKPYYICRSAWNFKIVLLIIEHSFTRFHRTTALHSLPARRYNECLCWKR